MNRANLTQKLSLALLSPLALLGVLEAALFLADFRFEPRQAPILIWNPVEDRALQNQDGLFTADDWTLWSPRPGATVPWGQDERVNGAGFRGLEIPLERRPGVARIATLGDSSTFGLGVAASETYSAELERLLRKEGVAAEVLNGGVVGFTLAQGIERYRHHVRPYRPDVVVAAFGAVNEHFIANQDTDEAKIARSQRNARGPGSIWSRAWETLYVPRLLAYLALEASGGVAAQRKRNHERQQREAKLASSAGRPDWEGTRRVALPRYRALIADLAREVARDGGELVVVIMPRQRDAEVRFPVLSHYSEATRAAAQAAGATLSDVRQRFLEAADESDSSAHLYVEGDLWHPNPEGHALMARELLPPVRAILAQRAGS